MPVTTAALAGGFRPRYIATLSCDIVIVAQASHERNWELQ